MYVFRFKNSRRRVNGEVKELQGLDSGRRDKTSRRTVRTKR